MQALIPFPDIHPEIFSITLFGIDLALRWYALAYIVGIVIGWRMAVWFVSQPALWPNAQPPLSKQKIEDLLFWVILGVVVGGRLGIVLFYDPAYYFANPGQIPQIWRGGMAFHGGFLGVIAAVFFFTRRYGIPLASTADMLAISVAPGILLGRLANFINAELWGRPADVAWAVKFPTMCQNLAAQGCTTLGEWFYYGDEIARHPSQLYESALEGLLLGGVLVVLVLRARILHRPWMATGVFFAGYGIARFIVEFYRESDAQFITPDNPLGFVIGSGTFGVSMGQLLSLPMVAIGLAIMAYAWSRAKRAT
jgi:phosphatidylglycerol:prolipoprotein diacylglycerol transferase